MKLPLLPGPRRRNSVTTTHRTAIPDKATLAAKKGVTIPRDTALGNHQEATNTRAFVASPPTKKTPPPPKKPLTAPAP